MADNAVKITIPDQPVPPVRASAEAAPERPLSREESQRLEVRRRVSLAVDRIRVLARQNDA